MANSHVLLLTICSNTKIAGGVPAYHSAQTIISALPHPNARELQAARRRVHSLIANRGLSRDGVALADLPYNRNLVRGPEFEGTDVTGAYLPAAQRYRGRFYAELGEQGSKLLTTSRHHVLILSGLYGLLMPGEPIQAYSLHVNDHPRVQTHWTQNDSLTESLLGYMQRAQITQVLDLTGEAAYRNLIAWESVRRKATVLHCFGEQNAGAGSLRALAVLARRFLEKAPDEALAAIDDGTSFETPYERVFFQRSNRPSTGMPEEMHLRTSHLTYADELGRMRRGIIRIVKYLEDTKRSSESGLSTLAKRIGDLKNKSYLPNAVTVAMHAIIRLRNKVEYDDARLTSTIMDLRRADYDLVLRWAQGSNIAMGEEDRNFSDADIAH